MISVFSSFSTIFGHFVILCDFCDFYLQGPVARVASARTSPVRELLTRVPARDHGECDGLGKGRSAQYGWKEGGGLSCRKLRGIVLSGSRVRRVSKRGSSCACLASSGLFGLFWAALGR